MKFFITALICFIAVISIIIFNCIYINNVSEALLSYVDMAENTEISQSSQITKEIQSFWRDECSKVSFSVSYTVIDRVEDYVTVLSAASNNQDAAKYKETLMLLRGVAEEISRLERLSFSNIF